jgi:inner membrane protein
MDSITHIALGACMGEAFAGKQLGKKAMLWGALGQSIPDIDFIAAFWMNPSSYLLAHRGFTHSFLFVVLIAVFLALIAEKLHRPHNITFLKWVIFFITIIFLHVFIDAFNNYGVGWFEPFNHKRVSFNAIYVVDPFFSISTLLSLFLLIYLDSKSLTRKYIWVVGLGLSSIYMLYSLYNKHLIDKAVKNQFHVNQMSYSSYMSTPAPLQNYLWYIVVGDGTKYYVGYRSILDNKNSFKFNTISINDSLLSEFKRSEDLDHLIRFSQQFYTIEKWNDTLVFNDLRFGQIMGWDDKHTNRFVFHFYLNKPEGNLYVIQRGRLEGWNLQMLNSLRHRIFRE